MRRGRGGHHSTSNNARRLEHVILHGGAAGPPPPNPSQSECSRPRRRPPETTARPHQVRTQAQSSSPYCLSGTPKTCGKWGNRWSLACRQTRRALSPLPSHAPRQDPDAARGPRPQSLPSASTCTSATAGCLKRSSSISRGYRFSPPRMTMSLILQTVWEPAKSAAASVKEPRVARRPCRRRRWARRVANFMHRAIIPSRGLPADDVAVALLVQGDQISGVHPVLVVDGVRGALGVIIVLDHARVACFESAEGYGRVGKGVVKAAWWAGACSRGRCMAANAAQARPVPGSVRG